MSHSHTVAESTEATLADCGVEKSNRFFYIFRTQLRSIDNLKHTLSQHCLTMTCVERSVSVDAEEGESRR
ncbi:hypothetical protein E2C01_018990 [Portunus trituberculatus]|uniref:Uncharacterized protein n=1 Tax=Portunus trituberculatus TaxID=210409 RepID=A0A5B7DXV0_PORTR|nr:hypothetical protein [Portunus trituberculatus]